MTTSFTEKELKFDVGQRFVLPALDPIAPHGARVQRVRLELRSVYYDTSDHALLRAGMTLRRRTGADDAGWQLKVPQPPFREEIRVDAAPGQRPEAEVPEELIRLLRGVIRAQPLRVVARLDTERTEFRLLDEAGEVLVEIADDSVTASAGGVAAIASAWREIEVELGTGEVGLLDRIGHRLRRTGARPGRFDSKLARALPPVQRAQPPAGSAAEVIGAYLDEQRRVMLCGDLALRRGDPSVIHKTRVATRRLRSTLRVFGPLFDGERARALDGELRWYAAALGDVRDRQVLAARLSRLIDEVADDLLMGPVRSRVDTELHREFEEKWSRLHEDLDSVRYLALLGEIDSFLADPPWTDEARRPSARLTRLVRRADRKVARRLRRANRGGDATMLHSARKAAKRARYAAEAAEPATGRKAGRRQARRYETLQDLLGEHQDSQLSAATLRRLGAVAGTTDGENGFAFGILHERERGLAGRARRRAARWARRH